MNSVLVVHDPEPDTVVSHPWLPHSWSQAGIDAVLLLLTAAYFILCWSGA